MPKANRSDAVFIRKSTQGQDELGQRNNVQNMLQLLGVTVPAEHWFSGTVSRRKVKANAEFSRLMEMVESDQVGTVYVESQDRWGTADRPELFSLLGILRSRGTRLYDLRAGKDLTEKDLATELLAFVGSIKSEKELQDISYRSLRSRVNNFKDTGSWPTGCHPYGYGKRCLSPDGHLLWEWQPVDRRLGQVFYPAPDGKLVPGPANVPLPRKNRGEKTVLVPSNNSACLRAVRLIFDLYTRVGLSRRQIAVRLNAEELKFNGKAFGHADVTNILGNAAYRGDIYFGKIQSGELHTFDANGSITEVKAKREDKRRKASECQIKRNTHAALVDRNTWDLAQKKLEGEQQRTSHAPRNPDYYLKQIFVCGHCGKSMAARTELNPNTGKRTVVYLCSSYVAGRINGVDVPCGYHRIAHGDAERLLLDKVAEMNLQFDEATSAGVRQNLEHRLDNLSSKAEELSERWRHWLSDGVDALSDYLREVYGHSEYLKPFLRLRKKLACNWAWGPSDGRAVAELRTAVQEIEDVAAEWGGKRAASLAKEHATLTLAWAKASELQQTVLKAEADRIEKELVAWRDRAVPVSKRLEALYAAEGKIRSERRKLLAEWPHLENREKGESLRRLFNTVTLFWKGTFHPAEAKPGPRKTNRSGRWSYSLQKEKIGWAFAALDSGSSK